MVAESERLLVKLGSCVDLDLESLSSFYWNLACCYLFG
jgi:hypothetical protein